MPPSAAEFLLWALVLDAGLPVAESDSRYQPTGQAWRFDLAWPAVKVAVEVEGRGRHQSWEGYPADCAKYNAVQLDGWLVLRYTPQQVQDTPDQVISDLRQALTQRGALPRRTL